MAVNDIDFYRQRQAEETAKLKGGKIGPNARTKTANKVDIYGGRIAELEAIGAGTSRGPEFYNQRLAEEQAKLASGTLGAGAREAAQRKIATYTGRLAVNPMQQGGEVAAQPEWSVYDDPFYMQNLQGAQSAFNLDRADALATTQYQERGIQRNLEDRKETAEDQRLRLAGNYAARGMAGGRAGALTRAEAETNAREITARTGLREQMAELNRQFTSQFGAEGSDWLGTRRGMEAQQAAIQAALNNRLSGLTTVG